MNEQTDDHPRLSTKWKGVTLAAVAVATLGLAACGGGGGTEGPSGGSGQTGGTGTVQVKVTDVFGDPTSGADVHLLNRVGFSDRRVTGASGLVEFRDVPAGQMQVCAVHQLRGGSCGSPRTVSVVRNQLLELSYQLEPGTSPVAAVLQSSIPAGGVSADGRQLDVTLRVAVTGAPPGDSWFSLPVVASNCQARTGQGLAELGPRCIGGTGGGDTSYSFDSVTDLGLVESIQGTAQPWAVGLLIDQSDSGFSAELAPNEQRLFAAKFFADALLPETSISLSAFSSDEPWGSASSLPQRPVTFYPVESPGFTTTSSGAFAVLDELSGLVGGGLPLYEAILSAIDFMERTAPAGLQHALVALADGADSTCGTLVQCAELRHTIVRRARESGIQLFLVGSPHDRDCRGLEGDDAYYCLLSVHAESALRDLSVEGGMPMAVGFEPGAIGSYRPDSALRLALQWLSASMTVQDVSFRLTSDSPGAFAPGAVVSGELVGANPAFCPWDCFMVALPFRVEIPR